MKRIAFLAILLSFPAQAATLSDVTGRVLVQRGEGFQSVDNDATVRAGDRILTGEKSSVIIVYGEGCSQTVLANQSVVVMSEPPCGSGGFELPQLDDAIIIGGSALILGGGAAIAIAAGDGGGDKPASP